MTKEQRQLAPNFVDELRIGVPEVLQSLCDRQAERRERETKFMQKNVYTRRIKAKARGLAVLLALLFI